jgi:hypothetical protein
METSRSFVGKMSCIAWYQVDLKDSDGFAACKFFHTLSYRVAAYLRVIRISVASSIVADIARSTPYRRSLNCFIVSFAPGVGDIGHVYVILTEMGGFGGEKDRK